MAEGAYMIQGDFVKINSKDEVEKRLPFLLNRLESWDYSNPLAITFEQYKNPRSLSQNAMSHIWYRQIAEEMTKKGHVVKHDKPEEVWKLWLKRRFIGIYTVNIGKEIIEDQVKSTKNLNKGEMAYFLDQVYDWATKQGVMLSVPHESEYAALQNQQEK
jgi:hypothetical protein